MRRNDAKEIDGFEKPQQGCHRCARDVLRGGGIEVVLGGRTHAASDHFGGSIETFAEFFRRAVAKHGEMTGQGQTVLVVDDEPTVRMLVAEVLEDLGYTAIEAAEGSAGLKVLQSDVRIDLLVTDVGLPGGMNGRQMADAEIGRAHV